ncbi:enoyl-CoA hydratase/isomerase family protein [Xenophilus sp. Marseille-Q4582]|uniref:enoyl-CoA hydratase/isomerase family protein n=1 Tax=Xenophilus sp. Marseille-Q4582 TaxID=2866600 RepID=UPI001CE4AFB8|nr:enoyl-CoA hydratase/isomerase family protein [Xenophilus sp. Marseille-Q4582]
MNEAVTISVQREEALATVTLCNPGRLNAMTRAMWRELRAVFDELSADAGLRAVRVRGEGAAFCAGGDISEYPAFRFAPESLRAFHEDEVWAALAAILACPVPVVAQITGPCMGAGIEIASCCDIRLAGDSATFGAPIARLGFPMAPREAALVRAAIGDVLARDMLLAAGVHGAARLREAGFLTEVLPDAELPDAAARKLAQVAALAPQAARAHKALLRGLQAGPSQQAWLAQWLPTAYDYADTAEHREGIQAFLDKRPPRF